MRRRTFMLSVLALAGAVSGAVPVPVVPVPVVPVPVVSVPAAEAAPAPVTNAAPVPATDAAPPPTYGSMTGMSPRAGACGDPSLAVVASRMAEMISTGARMIRCELNWWTVQPTGPSTWSWGVYDNTVTAAGYFGLDLVFMPAYTPPWARPKPLPPGTSNGSHVPPVNMSDFTRFVSEAAQRYSQYGSNRPPGLLGGVRSWEIWNEPNIVGFWNPVDPILYGEYLKASALAIRAVDPTAEVISGGLAPAGNINGNLAPDTFVLGIAIAGALSYIDGVGIHPYSFPAFPGENVGWNPIVNHVPRMYGVMLAFGAGNKKVWATEVGWPTSSQSTQTVRFDGTQVGTEAWQSWALWDLVTTWYRAPYAGPLVLYAQRDKCTDLQNWLCMMGIERYDGSRKPAYAIVQTVLSLPLP